jgi:hypothetical protein
MPNAWDTPLTHRLQTHDYTVRLLGPSTYQFHAAFRTPISEDDIHDAIETHRDSQRRLEPPSMTPDDSWDILRYRVDEKAFIVSVERPNKEDRSSTRKSRLSDARKQTREARKAAIEAAKRADKFFAKRKAEAGIRLERARTDWDRHVQVLAYETLTRVNLYFRGLVPETSWKVLGRDEYKLFTIYDILTVQRPSILRLPAFIEAKAALIPYSQVIISFWPVFSIVRDGRNFIQHPEPTKEMALLALSSLSNQFPDVVSQWIENWIENCPEGMGPFVPGVSELTAYYQWEWEQAEALVNSLRN